MLPYLWMITRGMLWSVRRLACTCCCMTGTSITPGARPRTGKGPFLQREKFLFLGCQSCGLLSLLGLQAKAPQDTKGRRLAGSRSCPGGAHSMTVVEMEGHKRDCSMHTDWPKLRTSAKPAFLRGACLEACAHFGLSHESVTAVRTPGELLYWFSFWCHKCR